MSEPQKLLRASEPSGESGGRDLREVPDTKGSARLSRSLFSSGKNDWQTPPELFARLDAEFGFELDVAAEEANTLCSAYISDDGHGGALTQPWCWVDPHPRPSVCWCNPPYSRGLQGKFIAKAASERRNGVTTVMLIPARTDTKAFHAHIWDAQKHQPREGVEVRFLPGRIKFVGAKHGAPFPSMVVVFRGAVDKATSHPARILKREGSQA